MHLFLWCLPSNTETPQMPGNSNLHQANRAKKDEFYTQLPVIEAELRFYKDHFRGKTVFCNCDDPYESNFFKYFAMYFNFLGLKKLIATCYDPSPVAGDELPLFETLEKRAYKIEITEVADVNGDGAIDLADVELLIKNRKNTLSFLKGNGDFRSDECIALLKEADIVVTNPPFSLFREYLAQLIQYGKKFIIIGNQNAITYKETFPYIKANQIWLGASIHSGDREFRVPNEYETRSASLRIDEKGNKYLRVPGVRWFTNLDYPQRHEELVLYKRYSREEYPRYDNYDAINVDKTADIPYDYDGVMGVPITFLDKYNPEQFEILGITAGRDEFGMPPSKRYLNPKQINKDGSITNGSKANTRATILLDGIPNDIYYIADNADGALQILYARILIRRKGAAK